MSRPWLTAAEAEAIRVADNMVPHLALHLLNKDGVSNNRDGTNNLKADNNIMVEKR